MTIVAINIRALHKYLVRPVERKNRIRNGLQDAGPLADGWEGGGGSRGNRDDGNRNERRERERGRRMFARTLRLLRPLKIHPGILPATDLNNVAGKGVRRHRLSFLEPPPRPYPHPRGEPWKSKTWREPFPDRPPLPTTPLKSLRAIRKAQHRSLRTCSRSIDFPLSPGYSI